MTFPTTRVDNAEILRRVRAQFRGPDSEWETIESAIERVFAMCKTNVRYLEPNLETRVADNAVTAAKKCLEANGATLDEVDLLICGGIARQYFTPENRTVVISHPKPAASRGGTQ